MGVAPSRGVDPPPPPRVARFFPRVCVGSWRTERARVRDPKAAVRVLRAGLVDGSAVKCQHRHQVPGQPRKRTEYWLSEEGGWYARLGMAVDIAPLGSGCTPLALLSAALFVRLPDSSALMAVAPELEEEESFGSPLGGAIVECLSIQV